MELALDHSPRSPLKARSRRCSAARSPSSDGMEPAKQGKHSSLENKSGLLNSNHSSPPTSRQNPFFSSELGEGLRWEGQFQISLCARGISKVRATNLPDSETCRQSLYKNSGWVSARKRTTKPTDLVQRGCMVENIPKYPERRI